MGIRLANRGGRKGDDLEDHERCVQKATTTGQRCKNPRMKGSTVCGTVHGRDQKTKNAAARRNAQYEARKRAMDKYRREGSFPISGPADVIAVLEDRLGVQVRMALALDEIVNHLIEADKMRYEHRAGEQLRGEVQAWIQLNQMVTKLGADYLKIDLAGKKVQIEQAQAAVMLTVIHAILGRLNLTRDQKRLVVQVIPEEFQRAAIEQGGQDGQGRRR